MEMAFLEVDKKAVFPQFFENPSNGINVSLAWVFGVDEDVIEVNYRVYVQYFLQHIVHEILERCRGVGEAASGKRVEKNNWL